MRKRFVTHESGHAAEARVQQTRRLAVNNNLSKNQADRQFQAIPGQSLGRHPRTSSQHDVVCEHLGGAHCHTRKRRPCPTWICKHLTRTPCLHMHNVHNGLHQPWTGAGSSAAEHCIQPRAPLVSGTAGNSHATCKFDTVEQSAGTSMRTGYQRRSSAPHAHALRGRRVCAESQPVACTPCVSGECVLVREERPNS